MNEALSLAPSYGDPDGPGVAQGGIVANWALLLVALPDSEGGRGEAEPSRDSAGGGDSGVKACANGWDVRRGGGRGVTPANADCKRGPVLGPFESNALRCATAGVDSAMLGVPGKILSRLGWGVGIFNLGRVVELTTASRNERRRAACGVRGSLSPSSSTSSSASAVA